MKATATEIVRRLAAAGHVAYFAGGSVRDLVRGVEPADIDIATSAHPDEVRALFARTIPVGVQFGVVIVVEGAHQFEVATFRSDEAYLDGRRPARVRYGTPAEDAQRRDFTVNGLFYDPLAEQVIDYVAGRADIERHVIRAIGDPRARFTEDKLRLLRGIRFAANLGFTIEPATFAAIQALAAEIQVVSAERVRDELIKIFTRGAPGRGLELLRDSGLLAAVLPEAQAMVGVEQPPEFHPEGDVFTHVKLMFDALPPNPDVALALAVLLHDIAKPVTFERAPDRIRFHNHDRIGAEMAAQILRRLRFPNVVIDQVVTCVAQHMRFRHVREMRAAKVQRLLARPTFPTELELHRVDCVASHGNLDNHAFLKAQAATRAAAPPRPARLVTGHDLLALGYPPAPLLRTMLTEIEDLRLEDRLTTREAALEHARQRLPEIKLDSPGERA